MYVIDVVRVLDVVVVRLILFVISSPQLFGFCTSVDRGASWSPDLLTYRGPAGPTSPPELRIILSLGDYIIPATYRAKGEGICSGILGGS